MSASSKAYSSTKFGEYVKSLHTGKNPLQHRCTLVPKKGPTTKEKSLTRIRRLYVYLVLLPYEHHKTKIYHDSFDSVDHARREHRKSHPYILHPFSRLRVFLDLLIVLPYLLAKMYLGCFPGFGYPLPRDILICLANVGVFYIFLNFVTGYCNEKKKKVILRPALISRRYALTYFLVDVGMLIPHIIDLVYERYCQSALVNLMYFVAYFRIFTFLNRIEDNLLWFSVNEKIVNRISIIIKIILLAQVSTSVIGYVKCIYGCYDKIKATPTLADDIMLYVDELRREVCLLYDSDYFVKPTELLITFLIIIVVVLVGTIGFAYVLAAVLIDLLAGVSQETKYNQMAAEVSNFARQEHRDPAVRNRIVQMFDVIFLGTLLKEQKVKQIIPDNLRRDLNAETLGILLMKTKSLSLLDDYLLLRILDKLKLVVLLPHDHLVTEGQSGDSMFFLSAGRMIMYSQSKELGHLDDGDNYAEDSLYSEDYVYSETVVAGTACFVYKLSRTDYLTSFKL